MDPTKLPLSKAKLGDSADWLEPFFGLRAIVPLSERVELMTRGDIGGFGIGSASDSTWNFLVGASYKVSDRVDVSLAYRWLGLDFTQGSGKSEFGEDVQARGPQLGATIRF